MKIKDLINRLSVFDSEREAVLFSNGFKEIEVHENEDGVIICGKGMVCPSVKTAIENKGREPEPKDLCSWGVKLDNSSDDCINDGTESKE